MFHTKYTGVYLDKEFNIKFGFPRSGTCSICDILAIKSVLLRRGKSLKQKKKVHLLKAEAFRKKKRLFRRQARAGNIVCLSFDYMQNLPLPDLKTNAVFYSHQLWHIVFGVHDLGSDSVTMFTYHEGDGRKGSNEVTSMLLTYINNKNNLWINFCHGQNKYQTMVHFLFTLVHCFHVFKTVTHLFTVRGHNYLPNDQDFSLIAIKKKKTHTHTLNLSNYQKKARKKLSLFSVVNMHYCDFVNMKADMDDYFLKSPKFPLKIKSACMLYITEKDMSECETHIMDHGRHAQF
ncbi:hypothetical protein PR048_013704 [Dryococelus australis]|uniref:DUF7869 domain-containing protein n=1 Tax=Dryococelus australis TaxID=614101 RepID=A0ABQ9HSY0_9NEOP|nr:hypothetical protein PR048_013704 [Dryococelus australis]